MYVLCIQRVLTVSEFVAEGTKIPDIMVTCGLHGYSLFGFLYITIKIQTFLKNKGNLDNGKLQVTKHASIYLSFWIFIDQ
jgi:hypothetical protein